MIAPKPLLSCQFQEGKFEIFEKNSIGAAIARQFFSFVENAVNVVGTDLDPLNQSPFTSNAEGTEGLATAKSIVFTCVRKFSKSNISFYVLQIEGCKNTSSCVHLQSSWSDKLATGQGTFEMT